MPYTLAALKTEIQTDPKALGYAAHVAAGRMGAVADLLNATYPTVGTVWRTDVGSRELLACLVWSELSSFTATQWSAASTMLSPATVDASNANIRAFFAGLFTGKTQTVANLSAVAAKVSPSRAEELWGYGTGVPFEDVAAALRS